MLYKLKNHARQINFFKLLNLVVLGFTLSITSCGFKADLYMAPDNQEQQNRED